MTLHDICKKLGVSYDALCVAVIDILEITDSEMYTIEIIDKLDALYEGESYEEV